MKKNRHKQKRPSGFTARDNLESKSSSLPSQKIYLFIFFLILLSTIALKIYKADHAGIIFDESRTFRNFAQSIHSALNSYTHANNHILNSIFVHYAYKLFGSYEHFIRIPSLLAGIMFSLSIAYIVYKTIRSNTLRIVSLGLVSLVPFVFNYSFLARGYAFALGGIFTAIAFVIWLLGHKIRFKYWLIPVLVISMMNFLTFGSMLSSVLILAGLNIIYVFFFSHRIFSDAPNKLKPITLNAIFIFMATSIPTFFLYRGIYDKIFQNQQLVDMSKGWKGWPSFVDYFYNLLVRRVFDLKDGLGYIILYSVILLILISIIYHLFQFRTAFKKNIWRKYFNSDLPGQFVLFVTGLTIIIMFIYGVILSKPFGFARNNVFLIPLVLTSMVIIIDRFINTLKENTLGRTVRAAIIIVLLAITLRNLPSPNRMGGTTFSKHLLQTLKKIDPNKTWNIAFSKKMKISLTAIIHYHQYDYKFNFTGSEKCDVYLCRESERPLGAPCIDWDYFSGLKMAVIVNCKLPDDKVVISARPIEN